MRNGRRRDVRRSSTGNAIMGLSLSLSLSLSLAVSLSRCLSLSFVRIYCNWLWNHITRRLILAAQVWLVFCRFRKERR